ncbi:MAG: carbohydrate ABC transporter permease, partial [Nocardioides sp.]
MTTTTTAEATRAAKPVSAASVAKAKLSSPWASFFAVVIAVLWTIPTVGLFISSFRPETSVKDSGWWTWFTNPEVTWDSYDAVLNGSDTAFSTFFINSIIITIPSVVIPITLATLAAYAFAWVRFPGRDMLFVAVFAMQIVPIQVTM